MVEILFAAHIAQLEAHLDKDRDRQASLPVSRFRLAMVLTIFGAMTLGALISLYPDPLPRAGTDGIPALAVLP